MTVTEKSLTIIVVLIGMTGLFVSNHLFGAATASGLGVILLGFAEVCAKLDKIISKMK